jgi:hypothetical protein
MVSSDYSHLSWKMGVIKDIDIKGIPKIITASRTLATEVVSTQTKRSFSSYGNDKDTNSLQLKKWPRAW